MRLTGYAEVWTGKVVIVRASPEATYQRPDPYQWALVALVNPETGLAEIQGFSKETVPITRETIEWTINQIRAAGFEPAWQRLREGELTMPRKMPHSKDLKGPNGKIDKKKLMDAVPDVTAALQSGETKIHRIVIDTDHDGKPRVAIKRSHNNRKDGLDPKIAVKLAAALADVVGSGLVPVGDVSENGHDPADEDTLTITAA